MNEEMMTPEILDAIEKSLPAMQVNVIKDLINERDKLKKELAATGEQLAKANIVYTETKEKLNHSQIENCKFRETLSDVEHRERLLRDSEVDTAVARAIGKLREEQIKEQMGLFSTIFRNRAIQRTINTPMLVSSETLVPDYSGKQLPIKNDRVETHTTFSNETII